MFYNIPGSLGVSIDEKCVFKDSNGNLFIGRDNQPIDIELLGKVVWKTPRWLFCVAQLFRKIDEYDVDHLKVKFNKYSRSKFPWTVWYDVPKYADKDSNYRVVPGYSNIAVSSTGETVDSTTLLPFRESISHGYKHVYCHIDRYNKDLYVPVYKLVALAWNSDPENLENCVVNHLSGIKSDDTTENIELTTYKGNSKHAVEHGLIPQARGCAIRNIFTGEIKRFPSLEAMNEFLGLRAKEINYFLNRRRNWVHDGKYEVRIDGDDRPWIYTKECQNVEPGRYILTVHEPNVKRVFNGVRKFIAYYDLWGLETQSCKAAVEMFGDEHPDCSVDVIDQYDLSPVEIRDIQTGEVTMYKSIKDLVAATGLCKTTVQTAIKHNGTPLVHDRYVMRHASDSEWPTSLRVVMNKPVSLEIEYKDTHDVVKCSSLKDAARYLKRDRDHIKRCIERPKDSDPYIIRQILPLSRETESEEESELLRTPKASQP